jgi:ketosteroid isomerase-like protein
VILVIAHSIEEFLMSNADMIIQEVEAFYHAYIDAFNREDTDFFLRVFCYPNAFLTGEQGMVVNAKESDMQRFYQNVMASIQARGWDRSAVDRLQVQAFSETLAMVTADYTRYKKDGAILEQGRACYMVRRDGDTWKMLTIAEIKPPFAGS